MSEGSVEEVFGDDCVDGVDDDRTQDRDGGFDHLADLLAVVLPLHGVADDAEDQVVHLVFVGHGAVVESCDGCFHATTHTHEVGTFIAEPDLVSVGLDARACCVAHDATCSFLSLSQSLKFSGELLLGDLVDLEAERLVGILELTAVDGPVAGFTHHEAGCNDDVTRLEGAVVKASDCAGRDE